MTNFDGPPEQRLRSALGSGRTELSQRARWRTALVMSLWAGDLEQATRIVGEAGRELAPVTVLDEVLAPAMHDIGGLWEQADITVADEHLATFVIHRLLASISPALEVAPPASRDSVLLATPPPERHTAGLLMAYDVFSGAGYVTTCLGSGVPLPDLRAALERHGPSLVGLSATMPFATELTETVDLVLEVLPEVQVLVGGAAAQTIATRPGVHLVRRLADLLATAERALTSARR